MDKLVWSCSLAARREARNLVDHAAKDAGRNPNVAVNDPYQVACSLAIRPAYVSDLGVRTQVLNVAG